MANITKQIKIGSLFIGGGRRIAIQSMTNVAVTDTEATLKQLSDLEIAGCDAVRIAVPDADSAIAFNIVRKSCKLPLIADIHFDYRLAVSAIENGADKIRINPGNIPERDLPSILDAAKAHDVPIRIGVNGGSINKEALLNCNGDKAEALYKSLTSYVRLFETRGFGDLVLSVKSSDVNETIAANKRIAKLGYPLHVGVTEAGPYEVGFVKNAIGIGSLLAEGIGDTVRVSLTDDPVKEVAAAQSILKALNLIDGVKFVSCPKCGRCGIDLEKVASEIYSYVKDISRPMKIAVMGCEVNGPGECADADLGMAGGKGKFVFFKRGKIFRTVDECEAVAEFKKEIDKITNAY